MGKFLFYSATVAGIAVVLLVIAEVFISIAFSRDPAVRYSKVDSGDYDGKLKFNLAESVILFSYGMTRSGVTDNKRVVITSVPVPNDTTYAITPVNWISNLGLETALSASYRRDTKLLESIAVNVTNRTTQIVDELSQATSVVGTLQSISLRRSDTPISLPDSIDVSHLVDNPEMYGCTGNDDHQEFDKDQAFSCSMESRTADSAEVNYRVSLSISAVPIDAIPSSIFDSSYRSNSFYYSACRFARVSLSVGGEPVQDKIVAVSDPRWLQSVRLSAGGTVVVSGSCGANSVIIHSQQLNRIHAVNSLIESAMASRYRIRD